MLLNIVLIIVCVHIRISLEIGEISKKKCEEYSKTVFSQQDSPALLLESGKNSVPQCGIVEVPLAAKGGLPPLNEFPHMAIIGFGLSSNSELSWQCGGALISDQFVLTAAHCVNSKEKGPAQKVKLGIIEFSSKNNLQELLVSTRIPHPQYEPPLKYNDIALLKLVEPVKFTPFVRPACLNTYLNISNSKAIAIGFGKLSYDAVEGSERLMKVVLNLYPNNNCAQSYSSWAERISMPHGVTNSMMCAGDMAGGKDTCQGDSGGPLQVVLKEPYCMYSLVGVTSFGKFCGFANSPAIYSRVSHFVDWIETTIWN